MAARSSGENEGENQRTAFPRKSRRGLGSNSAKDVHHVPRQKPSSLGSNSEACTGPRAGPCTRARAPDQPSSRGSQRSRLPRATLARLSRCVCAFLPPPLQASSAPSPCTTTTSFSRRSLVRRGEHGGGLVRVGHAKACVPSAPAGNSKGGWP